MSGDVKTMRILLVEDSAIMRKMEVKALKALGYEQIVEADDGSVAVPRLQEETFDLVISDWNMPNKDGYELLQWVRADAKNQAVPFIMATGQGDRKQAQKALEAGVSGFIAKPFNADELHAKIAEAMGERQEEEIPAQDLAPERTASGKVKLRVAHIQITDHIILGVLKALIARGEIQPKHFELETHCMAGWNPVEKALETGSVDAAFILAPIAMDLFNFGVPIKLVLLAHKNGSISVRSRQGAYVPPYPEFFKGRTFYLPHKMSVHHMLTHLFFRRIGLRGALAASGDDVDVNFEVVAPIKMPEFLRDNPEACGFMVAEPLGTKTIATGVAEMQYLSSELWENHPCCVVAVRDNFSEACREGVFELVELLVRAGQFVERKPEVAAEIGVGFLDPDKKLGLKVPILKNVLKEERGIKTGDLFPVVEDLDRIQQYMYHEMGIGSLIDLRRFVDTQYAEAACTSGTTATRTSRFHEDASVALRILERGTGKGVEDDKSTLNMEGKYLSFLLGRQEFGIEILKIKEIIGMLPIRGIPQAPPFVKGVINLRGQILPVVDLRFDFGMEITDFTERSCIIVLELLLNGQTRPVGIAVDGVSEVMDIRGADIGQTPRFCTNADTRHILGVAKCEGDLRLLLDVEQVLVRRGFDPSALAVA